jgi:hypothetical protein
MLNSLLSGLIFFSSFAMRTPNNPDISSDDYELSLGIKSKSIYFKRDYERELGEKYIDDEVWLIFEPAIFYIKPQYVNKTSRDLQYSKLDARYKKNWFSVGYTGFYSDDKLENLTSFGLNNTKKMNGHLSLVTNFDGYYLKSDIKEEERFDFETFISLNWKLTDKLVLSNILDYNDIKGNVYYKFKIGLEYKL